MRKFEHGAAAHLCVGDAVIITKKYINGVVRRIVDGNHCPDSLAGFWCGEKFIYASDLYHDDMLVIPKRAPKELKALINAQPEGMREFLVAVRVFHNSEARRFTIANIISGERLYSRITTTETACVRLDTDESADWYEGRPEMEDCETEYYVGTQLLVTPDDFCPERYV